MLRSLAKIAVNLDLDDVVNNVVARLYRNTSHSGSRFQQRFQILGYHKVSRDPHPFFEPVDPDTFDQHMRFLKKFYRVMDLEELVDLSGRGEVPDRAVAITFDDGYADNYDYAFPILKKYGHPATIFVATSVIGTDDLLWHDRIFDAFRFTTRDRTRLDSTNLPELSLRSAEDRVKSLHAVLKVAKRLYGESRCRLVEEVEMALAPYSSGRQKPEMLNWDQIREMQGAGISFGSHTVSHPVVSRVPREELLRELRDSKRQLSEQVSRPVRLFAYPNGGPDDYTPDVKAALKECGYSCGVTAQAGFNRVFADPYELKRDLPWHNEKVELFRFKFFLQRHGLYQS